MSELYFGFYIPEIGFFLKFENGSNRRGEATQKWWQIGKSYKEDQQKKDCYQQRFTMAFSSLEF